MEKHINSEDKEYFYNGLYTLWRYLIEDEDKKIEFLLQEDVHENITKLIDSLSVNGRLKFLLREKDNDRFKITNVLEFLSEDKGNVLERLNELGLISEQERNAVIGSLDEDDKIIEVMEKNITNINIKCWIVRNLNEDKNKIRFLDNVIVQDYLKYAIVQSFKDDINKINFLHELENEQDKLKIIYRLKEDKDRIKALHELNNEQDKLKIIFSSLKEEKDKIKALHELENEQNIKYFGKKDNDKYTDLGLPIEMTAGTEIEVEEEELKMSRFLMKQEFLNWKFKMDGSLKNGVEAVSPIMHNTSKDVESIYTITNILKRMGLNASERCGGHVHIGADYLKNIDEIKELLEIWGSAEKNYFLISNKPGELPREGVQTYATPISDKIEKSELKKDDETEFIEDAKKVQDSRYSAINLMNVNNEKNTIEFRLSNGTNDPNIWIENIRLYGKTVQMAHEISQIKSKLKKGQELTDKEVRKLECKKLLKEDISLDEKMDALMELLFEENEREAYYERYEANKKLEKETEVLKDLKFGKSIKRIYKNK